MARLGLVGLAVAAAFALAACGGGGGPGAADAIDATVPDADSVAIDQGTDVQEDVADADRIQGDQADVDAYDASQLDPGDTAADDAALPDVEPPEADAGTDAPGPDPALVQKVADCKALLAEGESGMALDCFNDAVSQWPDSVDAVFGAALSEMVYGAELSVMITSAPMQFGQPKRDYPADTTSENEYLAGEIHSILMRLRVHFVNAMDRLQSIDGKDLHFVVDEVPVFIGLKPTLIERGVFDAGDVMLMEAVGDTAVGFLDFMAGQDLDTDVLGLIGFIKDGAQGGSLDLKVLSHYLVFFLTADDRFLALEPTDGPTLFADARARFADAGPKLVAAVAKARDLGDSGNEVTRVVDSGGTTFLKVRNAARPSADGTGTIETEMSFELPQAILDGLVAASDSILTPGKPATLHNGVFPALATILSAAARSGLLDAVGLTLPIDLSGPEIADIAALLRSLMPNLLAFDWGAFFAGPPVGLRAWLPAFTTDKGPMADTFIMEWECPSDVQPDGFPTGSLRLLCAKGADLVDGPHFVGTSYETAADGVASDFPTMAFPDPTWSGLLLVDLAGTAGGVDASGYAPATNLSLNAALAKMLGGILGLLGGL